MQCFFQIAIIVTVNFIAFFFAVQSEFNGAFSSVIFICMPVNQLFSHQAFDGSAGGAFIELELFGKSGN